MTDFSELHYYFKMKQMISFIDLQKTVLATKYL